MQAIEINGLMLYTETLLLTKDMILWRPYNFFHLNFSYLKMGPLSQILQAIQCIRWKGTNVSRGINNYKALKRKLFSMFCIPFCSPYHSAMYRNYTKNTRKTCLIHAGVFYIIMCSALQEPWASRWNSIFCENFNSSKERISLLILCHPLSSFLNGNRLNPCGNNHCTSSQGHAHCTSQHHPIDTSLLSSFFQSLHF